MRLVFEGPDAPDVAIETARARALFGVSALFWTLGVTAGRLTAYSSYVVSQTVGALLVALAVALAAAVVTRSVLVRRSVRDQTAAPLAVQLKGE